MSEIQDKIFEGLRKENLCTGFSICDDYNDVELFIKFAKIIVREDGTMYVECDKYCDSKIFLQVAKAVALAEKILKENSNV